VHDGPLLRNALRLAAALGAAGAVIAVGVLLVSEMPELLGQGISVGGLFGALFGLLFMLIGGVVRRLRPNLDSGRESLPAFLGGMVGAGVAVRLAFGLTAMVAALLVFWGALGVAIVGMMVHHEMTTTAKP
jgi:hypothetical protein